MLFFHAASLPTIRIVVKYNLTRKSSMGRLRSMTDLIADLLAAWRAAVETFRTRRYWRGRGVDLTTPF